MNNKYINNNNNTEYYDKKKIEELKSLFTSAFNERNKYESLWFKIANYCGLNKYFNNEEQNNKKTDIEINNSSAIISLNQSSDSMLGILIGDGNFFKLKLKDKIEDLIKNRISKEKENNSNNINNYSYINSNNNNVNDNIINNNNTITSISKSKLQEYLEFVNFVLKEQFFNKESNFIKSIHKTIKDTLPMEIQA